MPVKAVVNGIASTGVAGQGLRGLMVKKGSPIKSPKELEGKKVAINTLKNISETAVREAVRKAGGDPDKVKFVELAFDQMPAALDQGQVDAACVVEPAPPPSRQPGRRGDRLATSSTSPRTSRSPCTSPRSSTPQKNPDVVKKFQEATAESLAYADAHPDEVRADRHTYTKIPAAVLEQVTLPKWPAEPNRASIEALAKLGQQDGLFEKAPDLDKLLP